MQTEKDLSSLIIEKNALKERVFQNTVSAFSILKKELEKIVREISVQVNKSLPNVDIAYRDKGENEVEIRIGEDTLLIILHTDIFTFDKTHPIRQVPYVQKDPEGAFCGMISVYNFLSDSVSYNRLHDLGYLITRIFINKDSYYFAEGKRKLGFLYNDFSTHSVNAENFHNILQSVIGFCIEFDMFPPPFEENSVISLGDMLESTNLYTTKGKRLGYEFISHVNESPSRAEK